MTTKADPVRSGKAIRPKL